MHSISVACVFLPSVHADKCVARGLSMVSIQKTIGFTDRMLKTFYSASSSTSQKGPDSALHWDRFEN